MRGKMYEPSLLIYYHKATKWNTHKQVYIYKERENKQKTRRNKNEHC